MKEEKRITLKGGKVFLKSFSFMRGENLRVSELEDIPESLSNISNELRQFLFEDWYSEWHDINEYGEDKKRVKQMKKEKQKMEKKVEGMVRSRENLEIEIEKKEEIGELTDELYSSLEDCDENIKELKEQIEDLDHEIEEIKSRPMQDLYSCLLW